MTHPSKRTLVEQGVVTKLRPRDMELVLAVHAHKSITAAALELGYTQPAASRALRDIEQLLRVHLFDRDRTQGMSLTGAGEIVLVRARVARGLSSHDC